MNEIKIANKTISNFTDPLIIADVGANFNGDIEIAKQMIIKAKEAGVDVVKFQSWTKDSIVIKSSWENQKSDMPEFGYESLADLLDHLALNETKIRELKSFCDSENILFASTPVTTQDVDLLVEIGVPFLKIASMDLNNFTLIKYCAEQNLPIILSTGMGSAEEIEKAVDVIYKTGNKDLVILHCTSLYPPDDKEINLNNIDSLREKFDCPVGYSDHTLGVTIPIASVVKGASVIEKHYTLDKEMTGWDHAVSATPEEFKTIAEESKRIVLALGTEEREISKAEEEKKAIFRRSVVSGKDLESGHILVFEDLIFKRPGNGIPVDKSEEVIGKKLNKEIKKDHLISWDDFE